MRHIWVWILVGLITAVMAAGCGPLEPPMPPARVVEEATVTVSSTQNRLVRQAMEDLSDRLDTDTEDIEVVEAKSVVWPDTSLGCPQPGMAYTQVRRDGMLILLRVEGRIYEYHSGGNRPPFLCEQATKDG